MDYAFMSGVGQTIFPVDFRLIGIDSECGQYAPICPEPSEFSLDWMWARILFNSGRMPPFLPSQVGHTIVGVMTVPQPRSDHN